MRENPVRKLYAYDKASKRSICKVEGCERAISGNHASNLSRHIKRFHPEQFILLSMELESVSSSPSSSHSYYGTPSRLNSSPKEEVDPSSHQKNLTSQDQPGRSTTLAPLSNIDHNSLLFATYNQSVHGGTPQQQGKFVKVRMDREKLMDALVEMVTLGGLPFDIMRDPGFRRIIDPLAIALATAKMSSSYMLTREDLEKHVTAKASLLRNSIRDSLKNAPLSVKFDVLVDEGTKIFLACHAFVTQGSALGGKELKGYALDLRDITDVHPVQGVGACLKRCLTAYDLQPQQIYRVSTDFCATQNLFQDPLDNGEDNSFDNEVDNSYQQQQSRGKMEEEMERENCMNRAVLEACISAGLFDWANHDAGCGSEFFCSTSPARALEGVIKLALQDAGVQGVLAKARMVVRKLRNPTFALYLKKLNLPIPNLDRGNEERSEGCNTRDMVETLVLKLQEFCRDFGQLNPELHLEEGEWSALSQLLDALRILSAVVTTVNTRVLTPSAFYSTWVRCSAELGSLKTLWAKIFTSALKEKLGTLVKEPLFRASLYLDPTKSQNLEQTDVEETLALTWLFIRNFEAQNPGKLDNGLYEGVTPKRASTPVDEEKWSIKEARAHIQEELNNYLGGEFKAGDNLKSDDYWNWMKDTYPKLFKIQETLGTIPYTRATIPKGFSSMNYSLTSKAYDLSPPLLNDVLLIRNNTVNNSQCM